MSIKVTRGRGIDQLIELKLQKKREAFATAISDAKTEIVLRTVSGKDSSDNVFAPYTPQYAAYKGKPNSKGKSRQVSPPNLTFTGDMLSSMRYEILNQENKTIGRISFGDKLSSLKAAGNNAKRKFFELSEKQLNNIKKKVMAA